MNETSYEYDVALSFAGEDRDYVEKVATYLLNKKVKVFYDAFEEVKLWGNDLYEYLHGIYKNKAQFCVIFISKDYIEKWWTTHERKSAQERALKDSEEYILPARFDDTEIPAIRSTTGFFDLRKYSPEEFSEKIVLKLHSTNRQRKPVIQQKDFARIHAVFKPNPSQHNRTFSEIKEALDKSILQLEILDFGRTVRWPRSLVEDLHQMTADKILYQKDNVENVFRFFTSVDCKENIAFHKNGTVEFVYIYRCERNGNIYFHGDLFLIHLIYSVLFVCGYLSNLKQMFSHHWDYVDTGIVATIPKSALLVAESQALNRMLGAMFNIETEAIHETASFVAGMCGDTENISKHVTRLSNFVFNGFHTQFSPKGFVGLQEDMVKSFVEAAKKKCVTDSP